MEDADERSPAAPGEFLSGDSIERENKCCDPDADLVEEHPVAWLVTELISETLCRYDWARQLLANRGFYELSWLAMDNPDPLVRQRAGLLLAAIGRYNAGEVLCIMADDDPDETVRAAAEEELNRPGLTIDPSPFSFGGKDVEETG